jgi:hypothetical protein
MLTFWLAAMAQTWAQRDGATALDKTVFHCVRSYAELLRLLDVSPLLLSEAEAGAFYAWGMKHLRFYAYLHRESTARTGSQLMRNSWLLQPKHHFLYHMCRTAKEERINPAWCTLLAAESWVGSVGKISRTTHRATVSERTLQRYLTLLYFRLRR